MRSGFLHAKGSADDAFGQGNAVLYADAGAHLVEDVGHFHALDGKVDDVGGEVNVVYLEFSFFNTLFQNGTDGEDFFKIKLLTGAFHLIDVAEELGIDVAVSSYDVGNEAEVLVYHLHDFLFRCNLCLYHLVHLAGDVFQFAFHYCTINLLLVAEVGIECAASASRLSGNVVHGRCLNAFGGKEFAGYINEFLSGFADGLWLRNGDER